MATSIWNAKVNARLLPPLILALALAACTPSAPPAAPAKATEAPSKPAAPAAAKPAEQAPSAPAKPTEAPARPAAQAEAAKPAAGAPADWEKQWNDLVAAAKREGKVTVMGPPTPEVRTGLGAAFQREFGIELEWQGKGGPDLNAALTAERAAGVYSTDLVVHGPTSTFLVVAEEGKVTGNTMGMLAPLRQSLLLPGVLDATKYRNGKLWFMDPQQQYILRISNFVDPIVAVNTEQVQPSSIKTLEDLLKPEFKGKIAGYDPSVPGKGIAVASMMYSLRGEEYLKKLYVDQEVFLVRDVRQLADLLAKGSYPIVVGLDSNEVARAEKEGYPLVELTEPAGYLSSGFGMLGLLDKAPHPNAARVFANWFADREASQIFQETKSQISTRNDVDVSKQPERFVPRSGVEYVDTHGWDFTLDVRAKTLDVMKNMLSRR